jgi:hypothetical protein
MIRVNLLLPTADPSRDSFVTSDLMRLSPAGVIMRRPSIVVDVTAAATLWYVTVVRPCQTVAKSSYNRRRCYSDRACRALALTTDLVAIAGKTTPTGHRIGRGKPERESDPSYAGDGKAPNRLNH